MVGFVGGGTERATGYEPTLQSFQMIYFEYGGGLCVKEEERGREREKERERERERKIVRERERARENESERESVCV